VIPKPQDRVRLPTGRLGTVGRVLKSGALAILLDDGEPVNLSPSLVTVVDRAEHPPVPHDRDALAEERARLARALYDARVEIQKIKALLKCMLEARKDLWQRYLACSRRDSQLRHSNVLAMEHRRRLREQYEQAARCMPLGTKSTQNFDAQAKMTTRPRGT
jgi:hypothetical protein